MNISKPEQRVLHVLAQGGAIDHVRGPNGKVKSVTCYTPDGHVLTDCTLAVFTRLKIRRMIRSTDGKPYRTSVLGRRSVWAQMDNH
jgi:uncharacterized protein YjhX (UPF0386 family)